MSKVKASLDHKRIRCLIWLVLALFVLLGYSLQSVAGNAYYSEMMQNYATVSSPPVILQNGTAGTSTICINNTSAKASVEGFGDLLLYVNADDGAKNAWTRVGTNPYLEAIDYNTNFMNASGKSLAVGDFDFDDSGKSTEVINSVTVQLYARQNETGQSLKIFVWDGTDWSSGTPLVVSTSWDWINWTVTTILDTWTKIDGARMYLRTNDDLGIYEVDCARLQVNYTIPSTYDYVLRVNNTVTNSWEVRLKKYANASIGRLQNCTIYFRNATNANSTQIVIENGSFNQTEGPWYNLDNSETIYMAITVEANSTGTSYVYTYLEIRTPNTTTYAQYVITFEIT